MGKSWVDFATVKRIVTMRMLIERYGVKVHKSGKELRGRCPIHKGEGENSFSVNTDKNIFNCFSCNAKGNILEFVAAMERCSIRDAALRLAEWYPSLAPYHFTLSRRDLLRHLFVLGPSGTGKSTLIIGLLRQFLRDKLPFWCVDFKRNYRCLLNDPFADQLIVLTVGRNTTPLRVNMLQPPTGVEQTEWIEALADIISTAYLLMQGARNVLKEALLSASTNRGGQATLRDALDHLKTQLVSARSGSRRYGWLESSYRSIEELTKGALGQALNATDARTFETLLRGPVVFELQGLGDDQKKCFCLYLLQAVLLLRKHQPDEREVLRHLLAFDEAHNIFAKDQWGTLSVPSKLAREIREYGEAIIAATQQADVADSLIANSGIKVILRTDYPKDVDFASKLLQIDARWLPKIPLGQGIARLPVRYYQPFLFSFVEQPLKNKTVSEELVRHRYTQWQSRNSPPVSDDPASDGNARTTTLAADAPPPIESTSAGAVSFGAITDKEHALLADIARDPISTTTQRYDRLGWNPKIGTSTNKALLSRGLVEFELVNTTRAVTKILRLTPTAIAYVRSKGVACAMRHVSAAHEYWRHQLTQALRRLGYTVTYEHAVPGGRVDVRATKNGTVVYGEIETGKHDPAGTIRKCAALDARAIILFTTNEARRAHARASTERLMLLCPDDLSRLPVLLG
jgi:hypothetical protein